MREAEVYGWTLRQWARAADFYIGHGRELPPPELVNADRVQDFWHDRCYEEPSRMMALIVDINSKPLPENKYPQSRPWATRMMAFATRNIHP